MDVIIAGGSGLIGRALAQDLLRSGFRVGILTRRPDQASLPPGAEAVGWDGQSARGWEEKLAQAGAVVNLVGENIGGGLWTSERKRKILDSRVQAGQALVQAISQVKERPGVLVQASAVGYYGPHANEDLDETAPAGKDYLARVAVDWENSTRAVEDLGVRRVVARTGLVLAPRGGILERFLLPMRLFAGGPLGSGRQWVSWIHMRDQVAALRFLIDTPAAAGAYNLTAPQPATNADFIRALARAVHRPYWLPAPAFALKMVLGEMSTLVLDGQKVLPARLLAEGYRFQFSELRSAFEDLFPTT